MKRQLIKRGRPKGSTKPVEPVYSPVTEAGKKKYADLVIRARRRKNANKPDEARKHKAELIGRLQSRYAHEFETVEVNQYGAIRENPKKLFLGRIFIANKNATGMRLLKYYYPERAEALKVKKEKEKEALEEIFKRLRG